MTLTVTLSLSSEAEAELRERIAQRDAKRIREMLVDALAPVVESLLEDAYTSPQHDTDWDILASELMDVFDAVLSTDSAVLSQHATTRAGIYEEHP